LKFLFGKCSAPHYEKATKTSKQKKRLLARSENRGKGLGEQNPRHELSGWNLFFDEVSLASCKQKKEERKIALQELILMEMNVNNPSFVP